MRKTGAICAVAVLLVSLTGFVAADFPAVHGTSVPLAIRQMASPVGEGVRVGAWYEADEGKLGAYVWPIVMQEWNAPVALSSNSICNDFAWYNNDNHTTSCTNFTSTTLHHAKTIAVWVNFGSVGGKAEHVNTSMTITGRGIHGDVISAVLDVECTSATAGCFETNKAFLKITTVSWTDPTAAASYDGYTSNNITFDIGPGRYLGLKYRMHCDTRLLTLVDADGVGGCVKDSAAGTMVYAKDGWATADGDWRGLWLPADVPDGTSDYMLFWIPTDVIQRYPTDPVGAHYGRAGP